MMDEIKTEEIRRCDDFKVALSRLIDRELGKTTR